MSYGSILVVEDSQLQGQMLATDLRSQGYEVTLAESGEAALETLLAKPFDLVLSDIVMPGIDGYQLCREIKQRYPDMPVVLLTSLSDPLDVVHGLQSGADNFLRKPYDRERLFDRISMIRYNQDLRRAGRTTVGLELHFLDQRFMITAERTQILDLLVSTFEDLVIANKDLRGREAELDAARQRLHEQLEATELERQRLRGVLAAVPHTMLMTDANCVVTDVSRSAETLLGLSAADTIGRPIHEVVRLLDARGEPVPIEERPLYVALAGNTVAEAGTAFDLRLGQPDGSHVPIVARAAPVRDRAGGVHGVVEILTEIGGLLARDPVTRLPTQTLFLDRLEQAFETELGQVAILAVILDRFDLARAALAPAVVDDVLLRAAELLTCHVGELADQIGVDNPTVAYLSNDTFAVMLPGLEDDVDAVRTAHRLQEGFTLDASSGDVDLNITASIGVAVADEPSAGAEAISAAAGAARRASADGGNRVVVFQPSIDMRATDLLRQEAELRRAITGGQLRVHYQPLLHVASERVIGVEALVRWEHPERGLLAPFHFIEMAEDSGLIVPLGWWVLRAACEQVRKWQLEVPAAGDLTLSVNLSAMQLGQPDAAEQVRQVLSDTGLPASSLLLEITETSLNTDPDAAKELLRSLKALGIRLAIDDFGTGYSTLLQLRNFPVDEIKIDKTFVSSMIDDPGDAAIVTGSVALGRNLGLEVVAEGVESADQLAQLRLAGCDLGQGYHWSKPLSPDDFVDWLQSHRSLPDLADHAGHPHGASADERPRDEVLGYIAHEIQNSLGVIRGFAELLADPDEHNPDTVDLATHIARAARQLSNTINAITDVSVIERGQLHLTFEDVDLAALAGQLVSEMSDLFGTRPVTVTAAAGVRASVDEAGVSQVLRNLLSNAAKFSPPESPIEVEIGVHDGFARVSVRDQGTGVPAARRPELFRRFSRLGSRHPGTGLGLYLSRLIARAHGGDLVYEPPADGGAQFTLLVPATPGG